MAEKGVVSVNGFEMEYGKFGSGDKVFVIIPGLSVQSVLGAVEAVESAYSLMKDGFTAYVFDRRKVIPDDYSIYDMADDTVAAIEELGLEDIYLFGASQGGMIAMTIAIKYQKLVKKLVLGSTSAHVSEDQQDEINKWIELAVKKDRHGLYQEFGKQVYPAEVYEQNKGYFDEVAETVTDEELEKFVILAKSIIDFDVSDRISEIDCPVLALGVFEDPVLDSDATMEIAERLDFRPDFALFMYIGYGHAAFDTAPDYKQRIYDFYMKE